MWTLQGGDLKFGGLGTRRAKGKAAKPGRQRSQGCPLTHSTEWSLISLTVVKAAKSLLVESHAFSHRSIEKPPTFSDCRAII